MDVVVIGMTALLAAQCGWLAVDSARRLQWYPGNRTLILLFRVMGFWAVVLAGAFIVQVCRKAS